MKGVFIDFWLMLLQVIDFDELFIIEGEELEILEKDGDGWCKVINYC